MLINVLLSSNVTAEVGANINKFCDITFGISVPNYPSVIVSPTS